MGMRAHLQNQVEILLSSMQKPDGRTARTDSSTAGKAHLRWRSNSHGLARGCDSLEAGHT